MQNTIGQYSLNVTLSLLDGEPSQEGQEEGQEEKYGQLIRAKQLNQLLFNIFNSVSITVR